MAILPRQGQRWLAGMVMLTLSGCAYIPHKPLVDGATTAQPAPASAP
ncbi:MAG: flagellar basal body L-ring protein, partial [Serratia marcescens]|nr:flagellar basal body L-ring protein [Serratia marcescens]